MRVTTFRSYICDYIKCDYINDIFSTQILHLYLFLHQSLPIEIHFAK